MIAVHEVELLPESLHFLNWGWWVIHAIAIPLVFLIGVCVGKRCRVCKPPAQ